MIDLTYFRKNCKGLKASINRNKFDCDLDLAVKLDTVRREAISNAEQARAGQKAVNGEMAKLEKGSPEFISKVTEMKELAGKVKELEAIAKKADDDFKSAFMTIPNMPHESVPDGKGEEDNQIISTWGNVEDEFPNAIPHYDIPWF